MSFDASAYIFILAAICACSYGVRFLPQKVLPLKLRTLLTNLPQFFIPLFLVGLLRVAVVEPFRIPSASMNPLLVSGDFILVNKYIWGIRLPFINTAITPVHPAQRSSVAVFRYPPDPSVDFIKRIVGVEADTVEYKNKKLYINGIASSYQYLPGFQDRAFEKLPGEDHAHMIFFNTNQHHEFPLANFPQCQKTDEEDSFVCHVPAGHYLAMGDNRDNSLDGRYWGFVPQENLIGRAFFVWMSFDSLRRIGSIE